MATLRVKQIKSGIGRPPKQRATLRALGLKRINHTVIKEDRPEIRGMLARVSHLVSVERIEEPKKKTKASRAEKSAEQGPEKI